MHQQVILHFRRASRKSEKHVAPEISCNLRLKKKFFVFLSKIVFSPNCLVSAFVTPAVDCRLAVAACWAWSTLMDACVLIPFKLVLVRAFSMLMYSDDFAHVFARPSKCIEDLRNDLHSECGLSKQTFS